MKDTRFAKVDPLIIQYWKEQGYGPRLSHDEEFDDQSYVATSDRNSILCILYPDGTGQYSLDPVMEKKTHPSARFELDVANPITSQEELLRLIKLKAFA